MLHRKVLYGALCGALLTLAGSAVAQKNPANQKRLEKEHEAVKPLIVVPGSAPRYRGPQGREADITELLATSAQTGGKLGMFLQTIAPGSGPPTHLHHVEVEFAYVLSGQFTFKAGDRVMSVPVGTFVVIPSDTAHTFKNTGASPGQLLFGVIPGGFEKMFAERQGVDANTNKKLTEEYEHVVGPPLP
jgi:quercetin 2,3-dioxygenase